MSAARAGSAAAAAAGEGREKKKKKEKVKTDPEVVLHFRFRFPPHLVYGGPAFHAAPGRVCARVGAPSIMGRLYTCLC